MSGKTGCRTHATALLAAAGLAVPLAVTQAQLFPPEIEISSLLAANGGDGSAGFVLNGVDEDDFTPTSVSPAGDLNADGIGDLLIGAQSADPSNSRPGRAYVVFGQSDPFPPEFDLAGLLASNGADGSLGVVLNGIRVQDRAGSDVSCAGDVNGDGFDDLIIGAYGVDGPYGSGSGQAYVIFGRDTPFPPELDLADLRAADGGNGSIGFTINGIDSQDGIGVAVSNAGDVNGDGADDLLLGARYAGTSGQAYVVFGRHTPFPAEIELSSLLPENSGDGSLGFVFSGISGSDSFARAVSSAGDINADGLADVIIGAHRADPNGGRSGQCYVVYGRNTPFPPVFQTADLLPANGGDGSLGFALNGLDVRGYCGRSVSAAGDVDGDGIDDIIVGAPGDKFPEGFPGHAYIVFGSDAPFPPVVELETLLAANGGDGSTGVVVHGVIEHDRAGDSVSAAGDVNGDGLDDIIIGAKHAGPNGELSGQTYVLFGQQSPFPAELHTADLLAINGGDGSNGFAINGASTSDRSGDAVSAVGDVNADGIDDVILGAPFASPLGMRHGQAFVVFGRSPACNPADLAEPFGVLDITDAIEYLEAFTAVAPAADLASPSGVFNFDDVLTFLVAFTEGCP